MTHSFDEITDCYKKAAELVANFGDEFLPVFLRAEKIFNEAQANQDAAQRARMIAQEFSKNL